MQNLSNDEIYITLSPLLAGTFDLNEKANREFFSIYDQLPKEIHDLVAEPETAQKIYEIVVKNHNLSLDQAWKTSILIRQVMFTQILWQNLARHIEADLNLTKEEAEKLTEDLNREIFARIKMRLQKLKKITPKIIPGAEENIEYLDIKSAIAKNKAIEEQIITSQPVKWKEENVTVKPSIKNWFKAYFQTLGTRYHSDVERINYLYRDENAKNLTEEERKILAKILRSWHEGTKLPISRQTGLLRLDLLKTEFGEVKEKE